jgi:hypothetical protein
MPLQNRVHAVLQLRVFVSVKNSPTIIDAAVHGRKTIVRPTRMSALDIAVSFS